MLGFILRIAACTFSFQSVRLGIQFAQARMRIARSGHAHLSLDDILRDRALCFLLFLAAGIIISYATTPWLLPIALAMAALFSRRMPHMLDERKRKELRSACDGQADVMADIVAMGVRSGLSFDAALNLYCAKFDTELARELRLAKSQWTSGLASRNQALCDFATRIDSRVLQRFSETSLQAIHHGSPLADMLGKLSADIRRRRRCAIERQVEKAPVKMLIPTGTCILPAMLLLVMGPVILQFVQTGY